ncbi:hypothetical protein LOTGIDRAFT_216998 [Lottia gigantea]|uniref:S-methyl-5'-thioadenosine phosphorylase n=1 Tax=Lottia gigantea TaxID=225164 RepID=V4A6W6_LOTGI|nr:hypothetical protein LOTGIDRAFT_216998 [Lottia gigantea]ESO92457.1 hypothetical protein LOTGIDRAFT_216998 [Lottia gigantea]
MVVVKVGIIGGSGLDDPNILENRQEKSVDTPYGKPSDVLITGSVKGIQCVLLARHGRKHTIGPSYINYQANIHALKSEGCTHIIVTTACGSLQEHIHPGDFVLLESFIDRTHKRTQTFYDGSPNAPPGICHIPMNEPFCAQTRKIVRETCKELGYSHHDNGVMITIEGPRFSTKAESKLWRLQGADVVNMSTVPEVVLANEAGLCYSSIALVTDYDCWKDSHEAVSVDLALKTFKANANKAINLLLHVIPKIASEDWTDILHKNEETAKNSVMGAH